MKTINISWADADFDMECDGEPVLVEQQWGNKGLGGIVFGLISVALALPTFFTVKQIMDGTAKGNPIGAIIALFVIFGWPLYWGFKQFFLMRRLGIGDGIVKFEMISLLGKKKYEEKIEDYKQIEYGRTSSQSRQGGGIGYTGKYFVRLPHKDRNREVILYQKIAELMNNERLQRYSEKLGLPIVDVTPKQTHQAEEFRKTAEAMLADRKK